MTDREPDNLVSIGDAVELLRNQFPDVSHSSLRFLEREGLISSSRTSGGHRLYAQSDIDRVVLIKMWQREGRSLEDIRQRLALRDSLQDPGRLSAEFLALATNKQLDGARRLILEADRAGVDPSVVFFDVLKPALVVVGERWAAGELPVHEEKAISEICRELVTEITIGNAPDYPTGPRMIAACVEGERHEIGIRMVTGLLRQVGYQVRYLGADVATEFLVGAVRANHPDAVLLSCSLEESFPGCIAAITALQEMALLGSALPVFVGGTAALRRSDQLVRLGALPVPDDRAILEIERTFAEIP